jgi:hypothetical protein
MVKGLNIFTDYFKDFAGSYVVIGGTACDILISEAGLVPRATKDIDIILVVEALSAEFVRQFWQFVKDGKYERQEQSEGEKKYYRFMKPGNAEFPIQLELFSRKPDLISVDDGAHLTPIPVDEDLSSLSAILLSDEYYYYIVENSTRANGLRRASTSALICLKAKAYLEMADRKANGGKEDDRHIRKHKNDVFRMAVLLRGDEFFELPEPVRDDMEGFLKTIAGDLPEKSIYKELGAGTLSSEGIYTRLQTVYGLTEIAK